VAGSGATRPKLVATLVLIAKVSVLFTLGRHTLNATSVWFPALTWLLNPLVWIGMAAVLAYFVMPPFLRVVQPSSGQHPQDSQ
jgi:hypothetical protein